jgi:hypothetical protein
MRHVFLLAAWPVVATLAGCPTPPTSLARAQQTAQEFNLDSRFGRELLLDRVAPDARGEFTRQHHNWGNGVRVADIELEGMQPQGEHEVKVFVHVSWYRPQDQQLRSTTLEQHWRDKPEGWQLVEERRVEGEMGLLGEPVIYEAPAARTPAQFPTVRLSGAAQAEEEPSGD